MFAIDGQPVRLPIWPELTTDIRTLVPIQAEPLEVVNKLIFEASFTAVHVGIFDTQNHGSAFLPREEPVEQSRACIADVEMSGWRRGKTHANCWIVGHEKMLAEERGLIGVAMLRD